MRVPPDMVLKSNGRIIRNDVASIAFVEHYGWDYQVTDLYPFITLPTIKSERFLHAGTKMFYSGEVIKGRYFHPDFWLLRDGAIILLPEQLYNSIDSEWCEDG